MSVDQMTATEPKAAVAASPAEPRRVPEWLVTFGVGGIAVVLFTIPYLIYPFFYYIGDAPESFVPFWYHIGEQIRAGQFPLMDPAGWYGGNYVSEGEYSLWQPVQVANYVIVSLFDDLAAASAFVMIEFLALLAMATYLLCRVHGASRVPSVVIGLAVPACGFSLFYAASGWPAETFALVWVAWFWWAIRRFIDKQTSPIVPVIFGVLGATTGNPYALLFMLLLMIAIGIELLVRKQYKTLVHTAIIAACSAATGALLFLPFLAVMPVTVRQDLAMIANDRFMVPGVSDLLASSSPTYLPAIVNWGGAVRETVPSTYFLWFAIPLLPWLRFDKIKHLLSVFVFAGLVGTLLLGPSNLWFFRWPIRYVEYFYLIAGVLLAVAMSSGLARDKIRTRLIWSGALIAGGAYMAAAATPKYAVKHLAATVLVAGFFAAALWVQQKRGFKAFGAVLLAGTAAVVTFQAWRLPVADRSVAVEPPRSVSVMKAASPGEGTILQLSAQGPVSRQDYATGKLSFGNESALRGRESVNRYSAISFQVFGQALCMDYKGAVCPEAYQALWKKVDGTDVQFVDAMRVRTLILQKSLLPNVTPPAGWRVVENNDRRQVWTKDKASELPGRVSGVTSGVTVQSSDSTFDAETVKYSAAGNNGKLLFARLNWPGYTATVDGKDVEVKTTKEGLISVDLPSGSHELKLSYTPPGLKSGAVITISAILLALVHAVVLWWFSRRTKRGVERGR